MSQHEVGITVLYFSFYLFFVFPHSSKIPCARVSNNNLGTQHQNGFDEGITNPVIPTTCLLNIKNNVLLIKAEVRRKSVLEFATHHCIYTIPRIVHYQTAGLEEIWGIVCPRLGRELMTICVFWGIPNHCATCAFFIVL